jgi:hypothetical protein
MFLSSVTRDLIVPRDGFHKIDLCSDSQRSCGLVSEEVQEFRSRISRLEGKGLSCFSLGCHLECLDEFLPHFDLHRSSIQSVPLKDVSLQPALVSGLVADHGAESIHCPAAILRAQRIAELLIFGGGHTNSRNRRSFSFRKAAGDNISGGVSFTARLNLSSSTFTLVISFVSSSPIGPLPPAWLFLGVAPPTAIQRSCGHDY